MDSKEPGTTPDPDSAASGTAVAALATEPDAPACHVPMGHAQARAEP